MVDGDAILIDAGGVLVVREGVLSVVGGDMMSVTDDVKMLKVGYDRLAALPPSTAVGPISLAVASEVAPSSLVVAIAVISETRSDEVSTTKDSNCVVML